MADRQKYATPEETAKAVLVAAEILDKLPELCGIKRIPNVGDDGADGIADEDIGTMIYTLAMALCAAYQIAGADADEATEHLRSIFKGVGVAARRKFNA